MKKKRKKICLIAPIFLIFCFFSSKSITYSCAKIMLVRKQGHIGKILPNPMTLCSEVVVPFSYCFTHVMLKVFDDSHGRSASWPNSSVFMYFNFYSCKLYLLNCVSYWVNTMISSYFQNLPYGPCLGNDSSRFFLLS